MLGKARTLSGGTNTQMKRQAGYVEEQNAGVMKPE